MIMQARMPEIWAASPRPARHPVVLKDPYPGPPRRVPAYRATESQTLLSL